MEEKERCHSFILFQTPNETLKSTKNITNFFVYAFVFTFTETPYLHSHINLLIYINISEHWNHHKCTLDEVFKGCVLFLEAAMLEPETQICGAVVIFDMEGLSMQQVWQFTPAYAKRIVDWLQVSKT
jgi:hypothetical protein